MTPILRHIASGLYFQGGASWTANACDALAYRDVQTALDAAYTSCIAGLELNILLFDDPHYTLRIKLEKFFDSYADFAFSLERYACN